MPIVVSNEGWVKVASKQPKSPPKPINPVNVLRGPLAYITGRPEFKEPVKKQSIQQLLLDTAVAAPLPPPPIIQERPKRSRNRIASTPTSGKSHRRPPIESFEEVDEEIIRPELHRGISPDDSQSRRSASPVASRRLGGTSSARSRRHESKHSAYDEEDHNRRNRRHKQYDFSDSVYEDDISKHDRARRHFSANSVYHDDVEPRGHHRSKRDERSYREHSRDRYHSRAYNYNNAFPMPMAMPQIQPIVIYPSHPFGNGCSSQHSSCHNQTCHQHQCSTKPQSMIEASIPAPIPALAAANSSTIDSVASPAALPAPKSAPSEVSYVSSRSAASRTMSYKWYTATQPLLL